MQKLMLVCSGGSIISSESDMVGWNDHQYVSDISARTIADEVHSGSWGAYVRGYQETERLLMSGRSSQLCSVYICACDIGHPVRSDERDHRVGVSPLNPNSKLTYGVGLYWRHFS